MGREQISAQVVIADGGEPDLDPAVFSHRADRDERARHTPNQRVGQFSRGEMEEDRFRRHRRESGGSDEERQSTELGPWRHSGKLP